ncbi:hypothetical protein CCP2SC5_920023 [Azospirillaceae bacterium]
MYSLETLKSLNDEEVKKYFEEKPLKRVLIPKDVFSSPDYTGADIDGIAEHFTVKKLEEYFVDSSGFGSPGEPAYTIADFTAIISGLLRSNHKRQYYAAITGSGQFQVYVTLFYKE